MLTQIENFLVYEYHFLDDLSFIKPLNEYLDSNQEEITTKLKQLFSRYGWEGDGELGIIWLPPFVDIGIENTCGHYVFHVKQSNNGTSFLASDIELPFEILIEQNAFQSKIEESNTESTHSEINIIETDVEFFKKQLLDYKIKIHNELQAVDNLPNTELTDEIKNKILGYNQCMIIQHLHDFIDNCFLSILLEVFNNGNSNNLKLKKSAVKIDLSKHSLKDNKLPNDSWFTIQMIISDIWNSFKFESFNEKLKKIASSFDYKIQHDLKKEMLKHVIIRNCIQHHNCKLEPSSLKSFGYNSISVLNNNNEILEISSWKAIVLSKNELFILINSLLNFVDEFSSHATNRTLNHHTI
ncbi:hypothetical protein [Bacillus cereus group sp. MYBK95-2]|uniref:hypothetical protein n=1 Tax=Bacillus cereus group sp. MYBK95-2 TaxID=3450599 RepID=UPI003F7AED9B